MEYFSKPKLDGGGMDNNIRVERAKKRISQQELADSVNVTRQTIHKVENNRTIPTTLLALKIARYFNVPLETIFSIQEDE